MAVEMIAEKRTAKYKVGDICMYTGSQITFLDDERNMCGFSKGSLVKIEKAIADIDVEYYGSDCNGYRLMRPIGEEDLLPANEETFDLILREAERKKKSWWKDAIKESSFAIVLAVISFSWFIFERETWDSFFRILLSVALIVVGSLLMALGCCEIVSQRKQAEQTYKEHLKLIERAKEELKAFSVQ